ncbi:MAG: hypothetical protein RR311_10815 [Comamonas sp.]
MLDPGPGQQFESRSCESRDGFSAGGFAGYAALFGCASSPGNWPQMMAGIDHAPDLHCGYDSLDAARP